MTTPDPKAKCVYAPDEGRHELGARPDGNLYCVHCNDCFGRVSTCELCPRESVFEVKLVERAEHLEGNPRREFFRFFCRDHYRSTGEKLEWAQVQYTGPTDLENDGTRLHSGQQPTSKSRKYFADFNIDAHLRSLDDRLRAMTAERDDLKEQVGSQRPFGIDVGDVSIRFYPRQIVKNGWQPYDQPHHIAYLGVSFEECVQYDLGGGSLILVLDKTGRDKVRALFVPGTETRGKHSNPK